MQVIKTNIVSEINVPSREPVTDEVLTGIQFDGVSTYMDLGIVPVINNLDSYIKMSFKAVNWDDELSSPYGYTVSESNKNNFVRAATYDVIGIQSDPAFVFPTRYVNPNTYQELIISSDGSLISVDVGGVNILDNYSYSNESVSPLNFFIGADNDSGLGAQRFTDVVFTELEFYNGVTTKTFNAANNWNGATNFGGVEVYSIDGGDTWTTTNPTEISIDLAIQDEGNRTYSSATVPATYLNGVITFDYDFEAVEGTFYFVIASQSDRELVKFKVFCTDQTDLQNYTTSEGLYKTPVQSNNDFIVID